MSKSHNKVKVFYSYSHLDEDYRKELIKRLTLLRKNGLIEEWHDRKLTGGDSISNEIDKNLGDADLILLLFSPDYMDSPSCQDEIDKAFEVKNKKGATIIPIILRICSWRDDERFKDILALPDEGKPVSKWDDADEAWQNVYEKIRDKTQCILGSKKPILESDFQRMLMNNHIFEHSLDKIFVYPDMECINTDQELSANKVINSKVLTKLDNFVSRFVLIDGEEQSGKTSLCRMLYLQYYNLGFVPVLSNGKEIGSSSNIERIANTAYKKQYNSNNSYSDIGKEKRILFIDDIDESKIQSSKCNELYSNIKSSFNYVIIFIDDLEQFSNEVSESENCLAGFRSFTIKELGHLKRSELLKKCIEIKEAESFDDNNNQMLQQLDKDEKHVQAVIGSNIVPSYPIFIVSIFQTIEVLGPQDYHLTSYGHCYQALITINLSRANVKADEMDLYFNYLTELAYYIFKQKKGYTLSSEEINEFNQYYGSRFTVPEGCDRLLNKIITAKLISYSEKYRFGYKYIYYYFVAKYFTENINENHIKEEISLLCRSLYKSDNANIVIFITHHSKDKSVLDEIMTHAICLFDGFDELQLNKQEIMPVVELLESLPSMIIENRDHKKEREEKLKQKDSKKIRKNGMEKEEDDEDDQLLIEIKSSIRSVEIIGQILKNRYGSLEKDDLEELFTQAQNLGLRLLNNFLKHITSDEGELIEFFQSRFEYLFKKNKKEITERDLKKITRQFVGFITYNFIYGMLHKIAHSIGYDKIIEMADIVNNKTNTEASKLINISIHTWYKKELDIDEIRKLNDEFSDNQFAQRILKDIVIQHLYMHKVDYREKQKLSSILNLPIEGQIMAQTSIEKA